MTILHLYAPQFILTEVLDFCLQAADREIRRFHLFQQDRQMSLPLGHPPEELSPDFYLIMSIDFQSALPFLL